MKYYEISLLFVLLIMIFHYAIGSNQFHFSLNDGDKAFVFQDDSLSEDIMIYNAICDKTVLKKPSFFKRMGIKCYTFWYCYSEYIKKSIIKRYLHLKKYAYAWYLYFYNYNNRIKQ